MKMLPFLLDNNNPQAFSAIDAGYGERKKVQRWLNCRRVRPYVFAGLKAPYRNVEKVADMRDVNVFPSGKKLRLVDFNAIAPVHWI